MPVFDPKRVKFDHDENAVLISPDVQEQRKCVIFYIGVDPPCFAHSRLSWFTKTLDEIMKIFFFFFPGPQTGQWQAILIISEFKK